MGRKLTDHRGHPGFIARHWPILLIFALVAGMFVVTFTVKKHARAETIAEWIHRTHPACCDHRDCMPVSARRMGAGWVVHWHGEEVPYHGEVRPSPAETWACGTPERIRCLFLSGGTS